MNKQEMTDLVIDFKENGRKEKKMNVNVTLEAAKLSRIYSSFSNKAEIFHFLNKSEKLDFALFVLERFMQNSDAFIIEMPTIDN